MGAIETRVASACRGSGSATKSITKNSAEETMRPGRAVGQISDTAALSQAAQLGIGTLHLEVETSNEQAARLYLSAGFKATGRTLMRVRIGRQTTEDQIRKRINATSCRIFQSAISRLCKRLSWNFPAEPSQSVRTDRRSRPRYLALSR
jgi:folate-dependent phosphoribosylglycinamide formyltransferase PurN